MNVTEFAERIVFGSTLEDKLASPGQLTYTASRSTPNVDRLPTPGRPFDLKMHDGPGLAQPPSDSELENEQARGRLLHFLANHELLATELMALLLLKFPDAPHAFQRGVLVTLQEEQEHTRLYLKRMQECGIEFGSFPLSGHFWRVVEPMQSPIDFVSRLSLTFEQANLDYSFHFASVFRQLGDLNTSAILERIYQDEIGHVQHGLHWFRQWKDPDQSDWEAYSNSLTFPMSPQRARGPKATFNREGRRQAGLTEDFIDAVEVFRQSRGRPPTVRWFDPATEAELCKTLAAREQKTMHQLGVDLECVMACLSQQDDVVLVRRTPSLTFRKQLLDVGFELPEFISFDNQQSLCERKLQELQPWAWTPANHEFAKPLLEATRVQPNPWQESQKELYRKSWSIRHLRDWLQEDGNPSWFCDLDTIGEPIRNETELLQALARFAERGYANAIFKQDLATSGRGQRRFECPANLSGSDRGWLRAAFQSGAAIVEPELNRLVDLSFLWQLPVNADEPISYGWTRPMVTAGRRYAGTRLGRPFADCNTEIKRFLLADDMARLREVERWLTSRLPNELRQHGFSGHWGVDAFVFRDASGNLAIKPLVELNPRVTMGHIALPLEQRLAPGVNAEFRILTRPEWQRVHTQLAAIPFTHSPVGQWKQGVVWLAEVNDDTKLVPVVLVGQQPLAVIYK